MMKTISVERTDCLSWNYFADCNIRKAWVGFFEPLNSMLYRSVNTNLLLVNLFRLIQQRSTA